MSANDQESEDIQILKDLIGKCVWEALDSLPADSWARKVEPNVIDSVLNVSRPPSRKGREKTLQL